MKYSWEFKLGCVNRYKKGEKINFPGIPKGVDSFMGQVRIWTKNYDDLGIDGLKHSPINKDWTPEKRFELVAKVLAGNSITMVARNAHVNSGQLYQWVRRYNEKEISESISGRITAIGSLIRLCLVLESLKRVL